MVHAQPARPVAGFKWPYIWTGAFVRFVDYAIPITAAALAVAYSLFLRGTGQPRRPFHQVVGSQLTLLVALAVIYTVVLLGFYPRSRGLLAELEELSREGRELLAAADQDLSLGREQAALDDYERYLAIDRRDQQVTDKRDELRRKLLTPAKAEVRPPRKRPPGRPRAARPRSTWSSPRTTTQGGLVLGQSTTPAWPSGWRGPSWTR